MLYIRHLCYVSDRQQVATGQHYITNIQYVCLSCKTCESLSTSDKASENPVVFDGERSISMTLSEYFTVTMTFDLLTSKCNQFILIPNCTQVVVIKQNFHKRFVTCKTSC